jgi:hypothetical protein
MTPYGQAGRQGFSGAVLPDGAARLAAPLQGMPALAAGTASAGNGGAGVVQGAAVDVAHLDYAPFNLAASGFHASAVALQSNAVEADQSGLQIAGIGGTGGNGNVALAGSGGLGAASGNGGDGMAAGGLVHTAVAVYDPVNIAVAGAGSHATAFQANSVELHQGAVQVAGVGGDGGSGNLALAGSSAGTGHFQAGTGGDGAFGGTLVHATFAIYHPVNIAIAGAGSSARAEQTNDVTIDQHAVQIAGLGGHGGDGNLALGSGDGAALLHLIGSDAIALGSAGLGGDGVFMGTLADIDVAVYAPINIAVAGYHATADAHQVNDVAMDQSTLQIAGLGGHGSDHNLSAGHGVLDFLDSVHLLG